MTDVELLQDYAKTGSETAFTELVTRHAGTVYACALRQLRDPSQAEEVVQAVFILLARKASTFKTGVVLTGWLYRAAHFATNDLLKAEFRRQRRETTAYHMNPTDETTPVPEAEETLWERVAPVLDQCLARLGDLDRHALLLRFFENKSLAEVGLALGVAEDAARKRVSRALDRLQVLLKQHGASVSTESLSPLLVGRSSPAMPGTLAAATVAAAIGNGVSAKASTTTLASSVSNHFLAAQIKQWFALGTAASVGAGIVTVAVIQTSSDTDRQSSTWVSHQVRTGDNYRPAGFDDAQVVHDFISDLQTLALKGDREAIARKVRFPLQVNSAGQKRLVANEMEFLESYDTTFAPSIIRMVLKCPRTGLYCDNRGVMIGTGEVWLAPEDRQPRIIALNLPD